MGISARFLRNFRNFQEFKGILKISTEFGIFLGFLRDFFGIFTKVYEDFQSNIPFGRGYERPTAGWCSTTKLNRIVNYSACRRRGGVLKCRRFWFFFGVESWAAAHGLYRCTEYRLLSEPMSTRLLNCISSRICRQNTQFNMYTTTSKQEKGCTFKDSHPKCFITTNFDKFHREAFARGGESR